VVRTFSKLPLPLWVSGPSYETWFLLPTHVHNPNGISIGSAVFAQLTADCHWACPGMPFPLTVVRSHGRSGPSSNIWFLEPTRAHNPIDISINSTIFAGLITVTDRLTDRRAYCYKPRSVTIRPIRHSFSGQFSTTTWVSGRQKG